MPEKNITFEIKEHLGVITRFESGWCRELNIISWNGAAAKYDIRDWDPHHERMKKGVTLHEGEMRKLVDLYLSNNSQKAVEAGRALEEQRRLRQQEQRRAAAEEAEERQQIPLKMIQTNLKRRPKAIVLKGRCRRRRKLPREPSLRNRRHRRAGRLCLR